MFRIVTRAWYFLLKPFKLWLTQIVSCSFFFHPWAPKKVCILDNKTNRYYDIYFSSRRQCASWLQSAGKAIDDYTLKKKQLRQRSSNSSIQSTGSLGPSDGKGWSVVKNTWSALSGSLGRSASAEFGLASQWIPDEEVTSSRSNKRQHAVWFAVLLNSPSFYVNIIVENVGESFAMHALFSSLLSISFMKVMMKAFMVMRPQIQVAFIVLRDLFVFV